MVISVNIKGLPCYSFYNIKAVLTNILYDLWQHFEVIFRATVFKDGVQTSQSFCSGKFSCPIIF